MNELTAAARVALALALVLCGSLVRAEEQASVAQSATTAPRLTLDAAVRMAEQRFHARVVRAESAREPDGTVYVLRLLDPTGRVFTVRVAADGGALL